MTIAALPTDTQQRSSGKPRIWLYVVLIVGVALMIYPLLWMIFSSFKADTEIFSDSAALPSSWNPVNYLEGWIATTPSFTRYYVNSFVVCAGAVVGNVLACSLTAFAFARLDFPLKRTLFAIMLLTLMLPAHVIIIPQYITFANLGWVDTYLPLIVPTFLATDAFFLFRGIEEIGHHGIAFFAGALVVIHGDDLGNSRPGEEYGVVVAVTVGSLHDDLFFEAVSLLRQVYRAVAVRILHAGGCGKGNGA